MVTPRLASGTVIARRFAIESVAGSGGMGVVYRAIDLHADAPIALKVLQRGAAPGLEIERFGREVDALAELRHPAIVRYVGHGLTDEGAPFLAMEWLDGEDLARKLRRRRLEPAEALALALRIAEALAAAHRQGMIHRDIKPQNIFLREGMIGRATLLDFGIARRVRDARVLTATGTLLGTPEYMAPEQARGQGDIGPAVDVFSLGCVLFECLAGRSPFIGEHMTAVLAKILFDDAPRLAELCPEIPAGFAALIESMLVKDPGARPSDGEVVHAALASLGPLPSTSPVTGGARVSVSLDRGALGDDEQWFVSVVVASEATVLGERITLDPREPHSGKWSALALHAFGAQVEELADGSIVATVTPSASLTPADQAVLAARCALLIHERLPDRVVAVATGRRVLSDPLPRGESIDRAVALLRIAAPTVRADPLTARLLGARFEVTRQDDHVFLIHGERITFDESQPLLGRPTPCLGREQELGAIEATLAACVDEGVARAVLVRGNPGMGKSRLRHEFLRRVRGRGDEVVLLQGRADLMQAGAAYAILRDALRLYCGLGPGDDPAAQEAKIRAGLGGDLEGDAAARVCEFLGELCGVAVAEPSPRLRAARRDPKLMHEQQSAAFLDFLRASARERPVLVVLDDLHWGDGPSLALLDRALRELVELPLMVLAFARPEIDGLVRDLWRARGIQELHLGRLGRRASERLVRHVLGADVDPGLCARLVEQAAGNALYLEELIRAAADGKSDTLPDTILAMLLVRLQRLDPGARRLLRAASCFGETFWRGGVLAILHSETSTQEPDAWLPLLVEQEILVRHPQSRIAGDTEYAFRHPLVREAAYSLLSPEDRLRAHYRAADYLERAGEVDPRLLAEHWQRAGEAERAAPYDLLAAEAAYAASDYDGTLRHAERGLQSGAAGELRGGLLALAGWVHAWRLEYPQASACHEEAATLARPGGVWWCVAMTYLLHTTCYGDEVERFMALSERFIATTPEADAAAETSYVTGAANLVSLHGLRGSRELARAALWRMDEIAARHQDDSGAQGWRELARSDYHRAIDPDPQRHLAGMLAARDHFARSHERRNEFFAGLMIGQAEAESGLFDEGEAALRAGVQAARGSAEGFFVNMATIHLAAALAQRSEADRLAEAVALCESLLAQEGVGAGYRAWAHAIIAEAQVRGGDLEAAAPHLDAAQSAPSTNVLRRRLAAATRLQFLRARGELAAARALAEAELAWIAAAGGAGYAELPLRLAAAEVYRAAGERGRARRELAAAQAELLARADRISDPSWRARYLAEVPCHAHVAALLREGEGDGDDDDAPAC